MWLLVCRLLSQRRKKNYFGFLVNCTGYEANLTDCRLGKALKIEKNQNDTCTHGMPAVISCVPGRAFAPTQNYGFRKAYRPEVCTLRNPPPLLGGSLTNTTRPNVHNDQLELHNTLLNPLFLSIMPIIIC